MIPKKYSLLLLGGLLIAETFAQDLPKWADKARKSVFSVVTYKENKILHNGNGFFISDDGVGLSDYELFAGADKAVIITSDGHELPVSLILGANQMYDIVKFKVETGKKVPALPLLPQGARQGDAVYLLPYSTQKATQFPGGKVVKADSIANDARYYTLDFATADKHVSCPLMSLDGQAVGIIQRNADKATTQSYALGLGFARQLEITALSANDATLSNIHIPTPLPADEAQAQVYLYLSGARLQGQAYLDLINQFIGQFPQSSEGYYQRATHYMTLNEAAHFRRITDDFKQALQLASNQAEMHYNIGKSIYNYLVSSTPEKAYTDWNYDTALEHVNQAISSADTPIYHQLKGDILFAKADYTNAATEYHAVNASNLATPAGYFAEAQALEMSGAPKPQVLALLDSAVVSYSKPYGQEVAPYLYHRSQLRSQSGMYREAVADLNDFSDAMMGQVNADFYLLRSQYEMQCRMYQQAIDDIRKATELEPSNPTYWLERGSIHLRVNQLAEADQALQKAINLAPTEASAYRMLGYIYIRQNNKAEGLRLLNKAKELGDTVAHDLIEKYSK